MSTVAIYDGQIERLKRLLSAVKRKRKSLVMRERMRRNHEDPAFTAKAQAALRAVNNDHIRRPQISFLKHIATKAYWASGKDPRKLPPMTHSQKLLYSKLRNFRVDRAAALAEVFKHSGAKSSPGAASLPSPSAKAPARPTHQSLAGRGES